ncbi:DUF3488 domain-containing protein, partial [bacterium]|nr:DUF3488 domain-containing protein [bacterium]
IAGAILASRGKRLTRGVERSIAVLAVAFLPIDLLFLEAELAPVLGRLLLLLQIAKLLGPREPRDEATIVVVALVHVAIASAEAVEVLLAPFLLVYAASATFGLAVRELRGVPAAPPPREERVARGFRWAQSAIVLLVIGLATLIFYSIPRIGSNYLQMPGASPSRMSGYSDQVALDAGGAIKESSKRAFRAAVVRRGKLPEVPLWRGRALHNYDGATWSAFDSRTRVGQAFDPVEPGVFLLNDVPPPTDEAVVDMFLEPTQTLTLFSPGVAHKLEFTTTPPPMITRDMLGTLNLPLPQPYDKGYRVTCSPERPQPEVEGPYRGRAADVRRSCCDLPVRVDRTRMRAYAETALREAGVLPGAPVLERARALEAHIFKTFRYTLDARRTPGTERVADFLFTTKEGHCEVFAGALAVLLRSIDIPARLVSGYKGGEHHTWTDSYTVRDRHAHAWVEAFTGSGWITLDPTPASSGDDAAPNRFVEAFEEARDWLEVRWFRAVISYDTGDQVKALRTARETLIPVMASVHDFFERPLSQIAPGRGLLKVLGVVLGLALVLGTALASFGPKHALRSLARFAFEIIPRKEAPRVAHAASVELEDVLRALAERGIVRAPSETATELAARALSLLGEKARALEGAISVYYRARYGGDGLSPEDREVLRGAARAVRQARS